MFLQRQICVFYFNFNIIYFFKTLFMSPRTITYADLYIQIQIHQATKKYSRFEKAPGSGVIWYFMHKSTLQAFLHYLLLNIYNKFKKIHRTNLFISSI